MHSSEQARSDAAVVARLSAFGSSTLYEAQVGGALPTAIKPTTRGMALAGVAYTVNCRPGDNLMLHYAVSHAGPGQVLVCDAGGHLETGLWGDVMSTAAQARGIAGLVVNGAVRDIRTMGEMRFPVFAAGTCMKGGSKRLAGAINTTLTFSGVAVRPGDYIIGDDDGVVCVARDRVEAVIAAAEEREAKEARFRERLRDGATTAELFDLEPVFRAAGLQLTGEG